MPFGTNSTPTWATTFTYFDKLTTGYDTSEPTEHRSKKAAIAAARSAQRESGGGIVVTGATAYPLRNLFRRWRTKRFTFKTRYSRA